MTETEARQVALASRPAFGVSEDYAVVSAEKRIIELVENGQPVRDELPGPGPIREVLAWVVQTGHDVVWAEFAIEDATRKVVRFRRSRGAVPAVSEGGGTR